MAAWVAEEFNRILGRDVTGEDGKSNLELVGDAEEHRRSAWNRFKVFSPIKEGGNSKAIVDTRWVLPWKVVGGKNTAKARPVAEGYKDPDMKEGNVSCAGCVSRRSSHLQALSVAAIKSCEIWFLDIGNAFLPADGFSRGVHPRAPQKCGPKNTRRIGVLGAPADV